MRSGKQVRRPALFGLVGYPLFETWSPDIHNAAFRICGLPHHYAPFAMAPAHLKRGVQSLAALEVRGFNVTVPHKETILPLLTSLSPLARSLGAVNTVVQRPRGWHGENTDVHGFSVPLWPYRRRLAGRSAVILGAGGAARAVAYALVKHFRMDAILVLARRKARAEALARWAQSLSAAVVWGEALKAVRQWRAAFAQAALVVNATPAGGAGHEAGCALPAGFNFSRRQMAYDLVYARTTQFLVRARSRDCVTLDGRAMLLEQAAQAFGLFAHEEFPAGKVLSVLKRSGRWPKD